MYDTGKVTALLNSSVMRSKLSHNPGLTVKNMARCPLHINWAFKISVVLTI